MAKPSTQYVCQQCGSIHSKWTGKCSDCGEWNSLTEEKISKKNTPIFGAQPSNIPSFTHINQNEIAVGRVNTGFAELDRVLGGGLVAGSAILIGGDPGIGKSTLLLQLADSLARQGLSCAYVSGEESANQISIRAGRLGITESSINLLTSNNVNSILTAVANNKTEVLIIDSIQTMMLDELNSASGTVSQVRACSHELISFVKERNIILILVGHVTKEGQLAGPKVLEHMVDTVLYFEGERGHHFRILRSVKNRFGGVNEIGVFEMSDKGLEQVHNPSALFLSQRQNNVSGSVVFAGIEGTRPILVEIQALIVQTSMATPRRAVIGWDSNRLAMVIAVLAARYGLNLLDKEVYLNVAGGLKITEPAADLAVAAALISAATNTPIPNSSVIFGEIGLSGEVRIVNFADARIKEAQKLGFNKAVLPDNSKIGTTDMGLYQINHIMQLMK
jgi:DNA repair protein RadA/Sms